MEILTQKYHCPEAQTPSDPCRPPAILPQAAPEFLDGFYNGFACGNFGYVRNDLPKEAKKFVQRHEMEHLLQTGREKNPEFSANLMAAKEYPLGFIQTIFFSIQKRAKYYDSPVCYMVSL